ncbi:hypothetical protein CR513_09057, partial [Mucuna pruriens]
MSHVVACPPQSSECCIHVNKDVDETYCRICHLTMDTPFHLGCSCKNDLAVSHKHCADLWFKIKGNKICEICGSIARNVADVVEVEMNSHRNEANNDASMVAPSGPAPPEEAPHLWQGNRFLNLLLAFMAFAFVISWFFHFNMPS